MNPEIDISNVVLNTKRLVLRKWEQSDLDDFYEYASVDGVGQMAGWPPHESKETSQMVLNDFISGKKTFAIEYNKKVIGSLGIEKYNEERFPEFANKKCREIGYVLSKSYWGQGLMPEAVKEVIRYLFEDVKLDLIVCGHFLSNHQSARVQEKCGFHHYSFGSYKTLMGTIEDDEANILTKDEWEELSE
jgi:ribosomal-protein-alanine N-acetyltransferase